MSTKQLITRDKSVLLDVEGMKCGGCVNSVEKILLGQPNIANASVNLVNRTAWIELEDSGKAIEPILTALANRGFHAKPRNALEAEEKSLSEIEATKEWWNQWRQLLLAIFLLLLSVIGHLAEGGKVEIPLIGELTFHAIL